MNDGSHGTDSEQELAASGSEQGKQPTATGLLSAIGERRKAFSYGLDG